VKEEKMRGVLFDMDGTIIDSEPYWMNAERELVEAHGGTWSDEDGYALVGSGLWASARLLQDAGVDQDADDIVTLLSARVLEQIEEAVPWRPGVLNLFKELGEHEIPCALVTMSLRTNAQALADAAAREIGHKVFQVIVAGDDVANPKPDPEAYLMGARLLGLDTRACVALEDSSFGAASAFSAGAITIGVPLHVEVPESVVHVLWGSLQGKTVADLASVWHEYRLGKSL
jgi:HAD superfamily hydrolase (TIGR01509 family)